MKAALNGHVDTVRLLLDEGAEIDVQTNVSGEQEDSSCCSVDVSGCSDVQVAPWYLYLCGSETGESTPNQLHSLI